MIGSERETILSDGTLHDVEYIEKGQNDGAIVLKTMPGISWELYWSMHCGASKQINQRGVGYEGYGSYRYGYSLGWRKSWQEAHP
jgi:hypothetical protein